MSKRVDPSERWILDVWRDAPMKDGDQPTRLAVVMPRRLRLQLGQLARIRGLGAGQLAARILARYMAQHYRRQRDRN
jgi:hypothetical protein